MNLRIIWGGGSRYRKFENTRLECDRPHFLCTEGRISKKVKNCGLDSSVSGQGPVGRSCKYDNESSGFIDFTNYVRGESVNRSQMNMKRKTCDI
jgi:hypothetical protein